MDLNSAFSRFSSIISYQTPLIVLLELTLISVFYVYRKLTFWHRAGIPNHVWHMVEMFQRPIHDADKDCVQKFGKIIGTYELLRPTLLIAEPELIQEILVKRFRDFSDHRIWAVKGQDVAECLFLLKYLEWKPTRQLISPAFTSGRLRLMKPIFDDAARILLDNLDKVATTGLAIDICPYINSVIFDIAARALFSTKVDAVNDPTNIIVKKAKLIFGTEKSFSQIIAMLSPGIAKLLNWSVFNREGTGFLSNLSAKNIEERLKLARNKGHSINSSIKHDLLQFLLDANDEDSGSQKHRLTKTEVIDNCILFYIGGYDTTSIALTFLIYNLAVNPSEQEILFKEIDSAFYGSTPDYDLAMKLEYLNACIYESLRMNTSLTRIERVATKDTFLGPVFVPKGTYVSIPAHAVHRDEDNFEDANSFKPERFLPKNKSSIKPGTFLSFADGPRNCIGYRFALVELKLTTCKLLQRFKFVATRETKNLVCISGHPIPTPNAVFIKVESR